MSSKKRDSTFSGAPPMDAPDLARLIDALVVLRRAEVRSIVEAVRCSRAEAELSRLLSEHRQNTPGDALTVLASMATEGFALAQRIADPALSDFMRRLSLQTSWTPA